MKNVLISMLSIVVCFFVMCATAAAGAPKPPKELCLKVNDSTMVVLCLSIKSTSSIKFADKEKIKYYTINGTYNLQGAYFPVGGTGYMSGDNLKFHVDGQLYGDATVYQSLDGYVDLSLDTPAGQGNAVISSEGDVEVDNYSLEAMECSTIGAPIDPIL